MVAYSPLGSSEKLHRRKMNVRDDPAILNIAINRNISTTEVILLWHLQRGVIVIPKSHSFNHIQSNIQVINLPPLSEKEMSLINSLDKDGAGRYIQGFLPWSSFA